jgi:hypothetical protein
MGMDFQLNQMPLIGGKFADPAVDAKKRGNHALAQAYHAYRPEAADSRMRALNNQLTAFQPVNQALGSMYGPDMQFDSAQAMQSPLTNRQMNLGAPTGAMMLEEYSKDGHGRYSKGELASQQEANLTAAEARDMMLGKENPQGHKLGGQSSGGLSSGSGKKEDPYRPSGKGK